MPLSVRNGTSWNATAAVVVTDRNSAQTINQNDGARTTSRSHQSNSPVGSDAALDLALGAPAVSPSGRSPMSSGRRRIIRNSGMHSGSAITPSVRYAVLQSRLDQARSAELSGSSPRAAHLKTPITR